MFVLIFVTGVIGNVIVCVVIVRHSTMHTATNYYLFSLAVSDLIFLLMGKSNNIMLRLRFPSTIRVLGCLFRSLERVLLHVLFTFTTTIILNYLPLRTWVGRKVERTKIRGGMAKWQSSLPGMHTFTYMSKVDYKYGGIYNCADNSSFEF